MLNKSDLRKLVKHQEKREKKDYFIFVIFLFLSVFDYLFPISTIIGKDLEYHLAIDFIPTLLGVLFLIGYKRKYILAKIFVSKTIVTKVIVSLNLTLQCMIFSYTSIGLTARVLFDIMQKQYVKKRSVEVFNCKVDKLYKGKGSTRTTLWFYFKDKLETIHPKHNQVKDFYGSNIEDLTLVLKVRKGLLEYYVLDDWKLVKLDK